MRKEILNDLMIVFLIDTHRNDDAGDDDDDKERTGLVVVRRKTDSRSDSEEYPISSIDSPRIMASGLLITALSGLSLAVNIVTINVILNKNKTMRMAVCSELHNAVWPKAFQSTADKRYPTQDPILNMALYIINPVFALVADCSISAINLKK
jgi:hypothetical protein